VDVGEFVKTRAESNNKYLLVSCACATEVICMLAHMHGRLWTEVDN
jgi:hypothetical protein